MYERIHWHLIAMRIPMSTDHQSHCENFEGLQNMLRELEELLGVIFYLYFGMPDYSCANRLSVLELQYSADDINACVWLNIGGSR
jgi:hypothetical protein